LLKKTKSAKIYRKSKAFEMLKNGYLNKEAAEFFPVDMKHPDLEKSL